MKVEREQYKGPHQQAKAGLNTQVQFFPHLGSFWMLSTEGDRPRAASGGRVVPDLLYGDSVDGQNCRVRYGLA